MSSCRRSTRARSTMAGDVERGRGGPARGYTWPPFEQGNEAAVTHSAYALLRLRPRADELAQALRAAMGESYEPRFEAADAGTAMVGAQLERAMTALSETAKPGELARLDQDARGWLARVDERRDVREVPRRVAGACTQARRHAPNPVLAGGAGMPRVLPALGARRMDAAVRGLGRRLNRTKMTQRELAQLHRGGYIAAVRVRCRDGHRIDDHVRGDEHERADTIGYLLPEDVVPGERTVDDQGGRRESRCGELALHAVLMADVGFVPISEGVGVTREDEVDDPRIAAVNVDLDFADDVMVLGAAARRRDARLRGVEAARQLGLRDRVSQECLVESLSGGIRATAPAVRGVISRTATAR